MIQPPTTPDLDAERSFSEHLQKVINDWEAQFLTVQKERDALRARVEQLQRLEDEQRMCITSQLKRAEQAEAKLDASERARTRMRDALDALYNHNEAVRAAVIQHYGLHHDDAGRDYVPRAEVEVLRNDLEGYAELLRMANETLDVAWRNGMTCAAELCSDESSAAGAMAKILAARDARKENGK